MQEVHSYLIMRCYNGIGSFCLGVWLLVRWLTAGTVPFAFTATTSSLTLLGMSCAAHLAAQMLMFYVNQKAQPALVSLISYSSIFWRLLSDMLIFGLFPGLGQTAAISALLTIQIVYMAYQLRTAPAKDPHQMKLATTTSTLSTEEGDEYMKV